MSVEKFDKEQFSSYTKPQLIEYIEQQAEQLGRFETRFRDVVRAYKGVVKEKEALETSLQALSLSCPLSRDVSLNESERKSDGEVSGNDGVEETELPSDGEQLNDQLTKLTKSLAILTEEKSKMESSFQQDKKNLLSQIDLRNNQLESQRETFSNELERLNREKEELQQKLSQEIKTRKEEESSHGEMVMELQQVLNKEREKSDSLNHKLKEALNQIQAMEQEDRTTEYEQIVHKLTKELSEVRQQFETAELRAKEPTPFVLQLQEDMSRMKTEHQSLLDAERRRANEAELKLQVQAKFEEDRVASLEQKLSELSEIVGGYDRQREQDQIAIQKLKERVTQLDSENTALTRARVESNVPISNEIVDQLSLQQEKVSKLRQLLKLATQKILERSQVPSNLEDMSVAEYSDLLSKEPSKEKYHQEMMELQHEFESYKQKAQSVLKAKNNKEYESNKELYDLQERYEELGQVVERLQKEKEEEREEHSMSLQKLRTEMRQISDKHAQELLQAELEHKQKLQDLQQHVQTTRERTKQLLEEKEKELTSLRGELHRKVSQTSSHSSLVEEPNIYEGGPSLRGNSSSDAVQEILEQPTLGNNNIKLFLHAQEQLRVSEELGVLRSRKLELQDSLRDLTEREQRHIEQNMLLKDEIRKLERDRSRETENFEYLKNVIFHFMCSDSSGREQLIVPIATVLHFTPSEVSIMGGAKIVAIVI